MYSWGTARKRMSASCAPIKFSLSMALDKSEQQSSSLLSREEPGNNGSPKRLSLDLPYYYNPMTKKSIRKVESVQKRFTKRLVGLSKISYNRRLEMLNIDSLEEKRMRSDLIMCYKILIGFVNLDRSVFFVLAESSQTRGNSMKLYKHSCNSNFYANLFWNRIIGIICQTL